MLVLVALNEPPDPAPSDFAETIDGELAIAAPFDVVDSPCDCPKRTWVGLESNRGTTTVRVVDRPDVTERILRRTIGRWLDDAGWSDLMRESIAAGDYLVDGETPDSFSFAVADVIEDQVRSVHRLANYYGAGAVLSRLDDLVSLRDRRAVA